MKLFGPREMFGVESPEQWRFMAVVRLAEANRTLRHRGFQLRHRRHAAVLLPRVDHGRWVADCRSCRSGVACDLDWMLAICLACGAEYQVARPREWQAIEEVLAPRPQPKQNWRAPETIADLRLENAAHGVAA